MMKQRKFLIALFLLPSLFSFSQENKVEMADTFYQEGKIYVVIAIFSIVLIGLAIYLFTIERKLTKLEENSKEGKNN